MPPAAVRAFVATHLRRLRASPQQTRALTLALRAQDGERAFHKFLKRAGVNHNHRAQAVAGLAENIGNTA